MFAKYRIHLTSRTTPVLAPRGCGRFIMSTIVSDDGVLGTETLREHRWRPISRKVLLYKNTRAVSTSVYTMFAVSQAHIKKTPLHSSHLEAVGTVNRPLYHEHHRERAYKLDGVLGAETLRERLRRRVRVVAYGRQARLGAVERVRRAEHGAGLLEELEERRVHARLALHVGYNEQSSTHNTNERGLRGFV